MADDRPAREILLFEGVDDVITPNRSVCTRCGGKVELASDDVPTFREMKVLVSGRCMRGISGMWWWCGMRLPVTLTIQEW